MDVTSLFYIDSTGVHVADFPTFLAYVTTGFQNIYGADIYLGSDSQDGQLVAFIAQALFDTANASAAGVNSFSPVTAQGAGLSRQVKINGLTREIASNSSVELTIVGQSGTVLTNCVAQDTLGQKWNIPTTTIPGGGTVTATAVAQLIGAISAAIGTVTTIFTPTLGWQSVTNAAAATPGAPVETDAQLRIRQTTSTALPALTVIDASLGALENLAGVQKVKAYENDTNAPDGNSAPAFNVYFVVLGGDDVQIAQTIALYKTPGVPTFGTTTEHISDPKGMPLAINFFRPATATIHVAITGGALAGWSTDYIPMIQAAVAAYINSLQIGQTIFQSQIFQPAYLIGQAAGSTYNIASITIAKNGGSPVSTSLALDFDENPFCVVPADVTVTIT
jgi:uncharacterized phage protein gp47/JayE